MLEKHTCSRDRRRRLVLRAEDVARAPLHIGAQLLQRLNEDSRLHRPQIGTYDPAPSARSLAYMCRQPAMRAPASGRDSRYLMRSAMRPGISFSASVICMRPASASEMSAARAIESIDKHDAQANLPTLYAGFFAAADISMRRRKLDE